MSCIRFYSDAQREQLHHFVEGELLPRSSPKVTKRKQDRLHVMANSSEPSRRVAAAGRPMIRLWDLLVLVFDVDTSVRSWVARNPKCPRSLLEILVKDHVPMVSAFAKYRLGVLG